MDEPFRVERQALRRSFERAAATYDAAAVLQNEVCRRMLGRLDFVKQDPEVILDAGCGTGNALGALARRYPAARIVALDIALDMARRARAGARLPRWQRLLRRPAPDVLCADIGRLPLAPASCGFVWSNLVLQWVNEPAVSIAEMHRVMKPGGLLMFSTFGPDTLKELRFAYSGTDRYVHVNRFFDMHDLGDMLVNCGFADPVMDMEQITLTYGEVRDLMRDLKAIGAHNVMQGRPAGLSGKRSLATVAQRYEALRRDGRLPATFEVVYGHAWKPQPRRGPSGRPVIDIKAEKGR
jgi:malonyl-CoA O-methyltransferase